MKAILLIVALVSSGCFSPHYVQLPPTASPQAKQAYALDGIVQRIDEFQTVVIDLATSGQIPTPTARIIVKWTVATTTAIGTSPEGWQAGARVAWLQIKDEVAKLPQLAQWVPLITLMLGL